MPEEVPKREEVPDDAVVVRFKPNTIDGLRKRADQEHRRVGARRLSVFADRARPGETEDDVVERLMAASELQGIGAHNKKFFVCTRAEELKRRGFSFWTDSQGDVPEHFSVDVGEGTDERIGEFISSFEVEPRDR
ncbi:hypothetical protein ACR9E3_23795 [Actinomycetospora sp. C-140]